MGDIGQPRRTVEAPEPVPQRQPEPIAVPEPAEQPDKVPA